MGNTSRGSIIYWSLNFDHVQGFLVKLNICTAEVLSEIYFISSVYLPCWKNCLHVDVHYFLKPSFPVSLELQPLKPNSPSPLFEHVYELQRAFLYI